MMVMEELFGGGMMDAFAEEFLEDDEGMSDEEDEDDSEGESEPDEDEGFEPAGFMPAFLAANPPGGVM